MKKPIDKDRIIRAMREILEAIGEDPDREGLRETPERVAKMYEEIFFGLHEDPKEQLKTFDEAHDELVLVKDIPFYSMCEHHLVPFFGKAHVAYIPKENRVVGISKLARVVEITAARPQLQERITAVVADTIMDYLKPYGVAVVIEAEHMCMTMRGVRKPGSKTVTSAMRGIFRKKDASRAEIMSLILNK